MQQNKKQICRNYRDTGKCRFGKRCRFDHVDFPLKTIYDKHLSKFLGKQFHLADKNTYQKKAPKLFTFQNHVSFYSLNTNLKTFDKTRTNITFEQLKKRAPIFQHKSSRSTIVDFSTVPTSPQWIDSASSESILANVSNIDFSRKAIVINRSILKRLFTWAHHPRDKTVRIAFHIARIKNVLCISNWQDPRTSGLGIFCEKLAFVDQEKPNSALDSLTYHTFSRFRLGNFDVYVPNQIDGIDSDGEFIELKSCPSNKSINQERLDDWLLHCHLGGLKNLHVVYSDFNHRSKVLSLPKYEVYSVEDGISFNFVAIYDLFEHIYFSVPMKSDASYDPLFVKIDLQGVNIYKINPRTHIDSILAKVESKVNAGKSAKTGQSSALSTSVSAQLANLDLD